MRLEFPEISDPTQRQSSESNKALPEKTAEEGPRTPLNEPKIAQLETGDKPSKYANPDLSKEIIKDTQPTECASFSKNDDEDLKTARDVIEHPKVELLAPMTAK
uniref:Prolactin receptor n=1 Tax=Panagrolaimus sp. JU765 TaxID=591449 RepID=A0AC34RFK6_9BILA